MENCYGIGVRNRYDLFYNDELDPLEILKEQEEERVRKKLQPKEKCKLLKPTKHKPVSDSLSSQTKNGKDLFQLTGKKPNEYAEMIIKAKNKSSETRYQEKLGRTVQGNFHSREERNLKHLEDQNIFSDPREQNDSSEYRRGRGGFRSRGRGRGRVFPSGGKQYLERLNANDQVGTRPTGKNCSDSANVWNPTIQDMVQENRHYAETWGEPVENEEFVSQKKDESNDWCGTCNNQQENAQCFSASSENVEIKENVPVIGEETVDETVREMTLDEWKREQESKRAVPKFNLRKPGEGEDNSQWKKLYMLKKKSNDAIGEEEEEEEPDDEEFGRRGRQRQLVDIQINFNYSRRGRGRGRGNRATVSRSGGILRDDNKIKDVTSSSTTGSMRLNRGQSKPSKASPQSAPRVDDWNDFPSLVTT